MHADHPLRAFALPKAWQATLAAQGFHLTDQGYERDGLRLGPDRRWLGFATIPNGKSPSSLPGVLGHPGLWIRLDGPGGGRSIFDLPALAISPALTSEILEDAEDTSFEAYLRWVLASHGGLLPAGWHAPERSCLESWIPSGWLTVQSGPLVRQGEIDLAAGRWSLRFPVLANLPNPLAPGRQEALIDLIQDAAIQWRMVRLGLASTGDHSSALVAEVDLSGAPHSQTLFLAALDALRHVVLWLVETADLLADAGVALRSLDHCRSHNQNERTEP